MRLVSVIGLDLFVNKVTENFVVTPGFLPQLALSGLPPAAASGPLPLFCFSAGPSLGQPPSCELHLGPLRPASSRPLKSKLSLAASAA